MWLGKVSGKGCVLPTYIRTHLTKKGEDILTTELFGKPYTDLIRCVTTFVAVLAYKIVPGGISPIQLMWLPRVAGTEASG